MRTLGAPCQLLLLCHEDLFIQPLVEGPHELGGCQHTVTNSLNREEGVQRVLCSDVTANLLYGRNAASVNLCNFMKCEVLCCCYVIVHMSGGVHAGVHLKLDWDSINS